MKHARILLPLFAMTAAGAAHAGQVGAGPAGTGSTVVGSVVVTPAASNAVFDTPAEEAGNEFLPGTAGQITLAPADTARIAGLLRRSEGAKVTGPIIQAPTTLSGGVPGLIVLDTSTNTLTIAENQ